MYIILIAVIGSMAAMMFYERNRVQNIEMFISDIRNVEQIITTVYNHRNLLTAFQADFTLTKSETVISYLLWWPDAVRFIKKISSESHFNKLEETDLFTYKTNIYDTSYHADRLVESATQTVTEELFRDFGNTLRILCDEDVQQ